eukprot:CAMPEP_0113426312 /NCGR_PEP_ID=MMETSP0013_2-20120614/30658_1 /TAXON_ID=2843 ORGANISM="Skeletonema costatum, Strain 1716" /NCGR_SAMPLE_ID=MMETSP0013_2 /ASSEMBLY_ACC=CAM_ASM_000158 /LENGTH=158 /DNA_ID=CAMNT_0000314577 /DNA_START=37 /DNA_END=513 /DNA_ORIENTATION=+ /assembly_acc=CAM_ASM_000158
MTLIIMPLLLIILVCHSTPIQAWTPRLASHSGRFFHAHNTNNGGGMKSLKATEKNQEDNESNSSDNENGTNNNANEKEKKKNDKFLEEEYLSRLERLYDASSAAAASSSLLESLTEDYDNVSSSSPGQSLLYGEKQVVVLGDWMGWEEGGSCLGDYCD